MSDFKFEKRSGTEQAKFDHERDADFEAQQSDLANIPQSPMHNNLREFRLNRKFKKQQMAEFMGVTTRTYYAYEKGTRAVPSDALINLATKTNVDLHHLLVGRRIRQDASVVLAAMIDAQLISKKLRENYPDMAAETRAKIASYEVPTDWAEWPRMHPAVIDAAIFKFTRYRYFPEDLPAPPFFEDYHDDPGGYVLDMQAWQDIVEQDFETKTDT